MTKTHHEALVLLGPTGSGKTPLGRMFHERGLHGRPCVHFDFGENLRTVVAQGTPDATVSRQDITFLRDVLATGALLEDEDFPIAQRLLKSFLNRSAGDPHTLVILNGLPRHIGQATGIEALLDVRNVVRLDCQPRIVFARIAANSGGDRSSRADDDLPAIERKLAIFADRTSPLVEHYQRAGAQLITLDVTVSMTPLDMWQAIQRIMA